MHVMYDFETLGQTPDTKVVSLGGVAFNKSGMLGKKYWVFEWEDQPGRVEDPLTVEWWEKQKPEARQVFDTPKENRISLLDFLEDNDQWLDGLLFEENETRKFLKPWGNGANFDIVILEDIYRKVHPKGKPAIPWAFWNVWCYRTFAAMTGCKDLVPKNTRNSTVVKHNALADAVAQTETILAFWEKQSKGKTPK